MANIIILIGILLLQLRILIWQDDINSALSELENNVNEEKKQRISFGNNLLEKIDAVAKDIEARKPKSQTISLLITKMPLRTKQHTRGPVKTHLPAGSLVKILQNYEGWKHVLSDKGRGWIENKNVTDVKEVKVTRAIVKMRVTASAKAKVISSLRRGEICQLIDLKRQWVKLIDAKENEGWVLKKHISVIH